MARVGSWKIVSATVRPNIGTGGLNTPKPFPYSNLASVRQTRSMMVTAAGGNAGTVYIAVNQGGGATTAQTVSTATKREQNFLKLTAGQSFTFSGMNLGSAADRDICFGSGFTYIHVSATPSVRAICTWLEQV